MRQVLSWRFVAALAALAGLALLVNALFVQQDTVARVVARAGQDTRRIELVSIVLDANGDEFTIRRNGLTRGRLQLRLLENRPATIFGGTPGSSSCEPRERSARCAILAETLGDTIVWFAFLPIRANFQIELPPIESLDGGYAELVNGWQLPYASVIDRSRCDSPAESFSEFLDDVGRRHNALYSFGPGEITHVVC
jgi:hypothetical protein